jgi:hypothetical protein
MLFVQFSHPPQVMTKPQRMTDPHHVTRLRKDRHDWRAGVGGGGRQRGRHLEGFRGRAATQRAVVLFQWRRAALVK